MTDTQERSAAHHDIDPDISVDDFAAQAEEWLENKLDRRPPATEQVWGEGDFDVSVFSHAASLSA